jgi:muramoyltetrapeptide carboxypeptidase
MPYRPLNRLPPGALVAVVAPAGPADAQRVAAVPALIDAQGWRARVYPGCHQRTGFLAGPDAQRAADLQAALDDPAVDAIWCLRGGYGSGRLLGRIRLPAQPKLLIGYSDITALHALLDQAGWLALHAPMPASDLLLPGHEADAQALFALLHQGLPAGTVWAPPLATPALRCPGRAQGRLAGGNLSLLAALCGTPWQPQAQGRLLFIEDVSESLYRVDRLLWQLAQAGLLAAAAGFVLGSFTEADDPLPVLHDHLAHLGKPVLGGWPAGHGTPNRALPLGALATLDADAGSLRFDQDVLV